MKKGKKATGKTAPAPKKRGKKAGLPKKGTPERAAVERTVKDMAKPDENGWMPTPSKLPASAGWRKKGKGPSPRFYRKKAGKPLLRSQIFDRNEIRRLQEENQALKELLGRYLVEKVLSVKSRGEYLAGLGKE